MEESERSKKRTVEKMRKYSRKDNLDNGEENEKQESK